MKDLSKAQMTQGIKSFFLDRHLCSTFFKTRQQKDGGMKRLQMCMFDSDFYLQQVRILHLECKRPSEKSKRRLKSKSHLLKFSYFQNNFFSKLKKFHNFIDVTAIWLFSTIMTIAFFRRFIQTPKRVFLRLLTLACTSV